MSRIRWLPRLALGLSAALCAGSPPAETGVRLPDRIGRILAAAPATSARVGVSVVSIPDGAEIAGRRAGEVFAPASNMKIATTAAALSRLGPDFKFSTRICAKGRIEDGVLKGDLGVVGSGDPNFSGRFYADDPYGAFRGWARQMKKLSISVVEGDLVLDDGAFDREGVHPAWPGSQLQEWYCAPVSALSFNDGCVEIHVSPGRSGEAARVRFIPASAPIRLLNAAVTTSDRAAHRVIVTRSPDGQTISVGGKVWDRAETLKEFVAVKDPAMFFGSGLRAAFEAEGIAVRGKVRLVAAGERVGGEGWTALLEHASGLVQAIEVANRRSQNLYAEQIFKALGKDAKGEGTFAKGSEAVRDYLASIGIRDPLVVVDDGSGLSRNNRVAPAHLTRILAEMWRSPQRDIFRNSLATPGGEGTLSKRFPDARLEGRLFAKTGTIAGVSALSGYAKGEDDRWRAFSVLVQFEGKGFSLADARRIEDRIAIEVAKGP